MQRSDDRLLWTCPPLLSRIEFTATNGSRITSFIASYVYSSLIGNYEGLFRNDNGQSDPNITSLFDLVSLLQDNLDAFQTTVHLSSSSTVHTRPRGSCRFWQLLCTVGFSVQCLIPHPVYGNNEGFGFCDNPANTANPIPGVCTPRGTAIVPSVAQQQAGFPNVVDSVGTNRTPTTFNLDLGFYYPIKFGEKKELRLSADWFNVTNTQRAVTLDQTEALNSGVTGVPP